MPMIVPAAREVAADAARSGTEPARAEPVGAEFLPNAENGASPDAEGEPDLLPQPAMPNRQSNKNKGIFRRSILNKLTVYSRTP